MKLPDGSRRRLLRSRYFGDSVRWKQDKKYGRVYKPWLYLLDDGRFVLCKSGSKTTMKFVYRYGRQLDLWRYG